MDCKDAKNIEENEAVTQIKNGGFKYLIQYFSALGAALAFGICGLYFGWIGPTLAILLDKEITPIPITVSQSSWLSVCLQLGALLGPIIGSYLSDHVGRKKAILFCGIPNILTNVLVCFANSVELLYIARILSGVTIGICFVAVPIYTSEISSPEIRGKLGVILELFLSMGILFEHCVIPFVTIKLNGIICLIIVVIQFIYFFFVPESPYFYVTKDKDNLAEMSLKKLQQTDDVTEKMAILRTDWIKQKENKVNVFDICRTPVNRRCLVIVIGLIAIQQLSGFGILLSYAEIIFKISNTPIPASYSGIIFISINVITIFISSHVIDGWGRRPLYLLSTLASILPLILVGIFFYLRAIEYEHIFQLSSIPLIGIILYVIAFGLAVQTFPYVISGEIFATNYRSIANTIMSIFGSFCGFVLTKLSEKIADNFGIYTMFWIFAFCNLCGALFGYIYLPETKKKTLEEIQEELQLISHKNKTSSSQLI